MSTRATCAGRISVLVTDDFITIPIIDMSTHSQSLTLPTGPLQAECLDPLQAECLDGTRSSRSTVKVSKSVEKPFVEIHGIRNSVCIRRTAGRCLPQTGIDQHGHLSSDSCKGCKRRNFPIPLPVLCILSRFNESVLNLWILRFA